MNEDLQKYYTDPKTQVILQYGQEMLRQLIGKTDQTSQVISAEFTESNGDAGTSILKEKTSDQLISGEQAEMRNIKGICSWPV